MWISAITRKEDRELTVEHDISSVGGIKRQFFRRQGMAGGGHVGPDRGNQSQTS